MSQFVGFGVQVELKDGKRIQGRIAKATAKGLTLNDVVFGDGGTSQAFKVRASRLKDLKVLSVARKTHHTPKVSPPASQGQDWQNDDVNKLKQQDDFDFQGNLKMFNKKDVFAQLKQQDDVQPQQRLVSHNKKPENIANDQSVIPNAKEDAWDVDDEKYYDAQLLPVTKSINITHLLHNKGGDDQEADDEEEEEEESEEEKVIAKIKQALRSDRPALLRAKEINLQVLMANPVQLLEMERVSAEQYGIHAPIVVENFGNNASFVLKQKLGGRIRLRLDNMNPGPLVVIMASDSYRSGARALSLGRHLCQTGHVRVVVVFISQDLQDNHVLQQMDLFRRSGGKIVNGITQLESLVDKLNTPVECVIDAIQGFDCNLSDLYYNEALSPLENRVRSLIQWCNSLHNIQIWSLDIPAGFDSTTGTQNFDDAVRATGVLSSGWPLAALHAVKDQLKDQLTEVVAIDVGTPQGVYAQTSLRKFQSYDVFVTEGSLSLDI
ncbi:hypothetical protein ZYGR_0P01440 [Zygosaccharomyces rouxii]|uniref:Enhancer of mRNA-decapping protein 3 n=1 Tax=Zygosaccharomyces rouxii TaxID=4956 RepID=A0A1Q3A1L6_ZYGRO|nr:hypothetical protein ZYGR_0P01440 [Zygosaccharomyces rouxii]